jgi:hypothetical protein
MSRNIFTKARIKGAAGIAGLTVAGVVIATLPGFAGTLASWNDVEWVSATQGGDEPGIGTGDCEAPDTYSTRGGGEFLSSSLLTLDELAGLGVLLAENPGDGSNSTIYPAGVAPEGANPPERNQYYDEVTLSLLNGAISAAFDDLIDLDTNNEIGVLGSYAEAQSDGYSAGGSGLITNTGSLVDLDPNNPDQFDTMGSLSLTNVVDSLGLINPDFVDYLATLDLDLGAVGAEANLDACAADWDDDVYAHLYRDYLIAGLDLNIGSSLVSDIGGLITTALNDIEALRISALTSLTATLNALNIAGLANISANPTITINTAALSAALSQVYNGNDIVYLDLVNGKISIDLANLLGGPNGLNDLDPNTELLLSPEIIQALETAILDAINDLAVAVSTAVANIASSITIGGTISATASVLGFPVGVTIPLSGGPIGLSLGFPCADVIGLCLALTTLGTTLGGLLGGVTTAVNGVIPALSPLVTGVLGVLTGALAAVNVIDSVLIEFVSDLLDPLFGVDGLLSIVVNAQNRPVPPNSWLTPPVPAEFESLPAGQYDVAALRIGIADFLGPDLNVDVTLARATVGINTPVP